MDEQPLRVVIVDDETAARRGLRRMLEANESPRVIVVGEAKNGLDGFQVIRETDPDLLFLDVQMPGLDGMGLATLLEGERPLLVFVTAHREYALRAFEQRALDYLLKPFDQGRLQQTLSRVPSALPRLDSADRKDPKTDPETEYATRLLAKSGRDASVVAVASILSIESASNYVYLHTNDKSFILRTTLADLETKLDPTEFLRVHRSWIVRLTAIVRMKKIGGGDVRLELDDGSALPMSRNYRGKFEEQVGRIP